MLLSHFRSVHPDWDQRQIEREAALRLSHPMEQSELLRFAVSVLERLHLPYFVTGSTVTIFYGEPRFTNDIAIVVGVPAGTVQEFCRQFPEEAFYVSQEAANDAASQLHGWTTGRHSVGARYTRNVYQWCIIGSCAPTSISTTPWSRRRWPSRANGPRLERSIVRFLNSCGSSACDA